MKYRVRSLKPVESAWFEVEFSGPALEAANQVHCDRDGSGITSISMTRDTEDGGREKVKFALMEVEGHGEVVSRLFESGIWRKGIRKPGPTLASIAETLGWGHAPEALLEDDWAGEETYDDAVAR